MKSSVNIMSVNDLESATGITRGFIRMALGSYRLSKHVITNHPVSVDCNEDFINNFRSFLEIKNRLDLISKLDRLKDVVLS